MRSNPLLIVATLWLAPTAAAAQFWTQVTTPTNQDLNGVVVTPGLALTVGNGGVALASDGGPWTLVDSGTSNDLLDVVYNPGTGFAVGGVDVLLEGDGVAPLTPLVETTTGQAYTPVLSTDEEIWFGAPSFQFGGFSLLSRYDRSTGTTPGIVVEGPVLLLCSVPAADRVRYVTTRGDVVEMTDGFAKTVLVDQSSTSALNLVNGHFSEDCTRVVASNQVLTTVFNVMIVDLEPGATASATPSSAARAAEPPIWQRKVVDKFDIDIDSEYVRVDIEDGIIEVWKAELEEDGDLDWYRYETLDCNKWSMENQPVPIVKRILAGDKESDWSGEFELSVAVGEEGSLAYKFEPRPIFASSFENGTADWSMTVGETE